MKPVSTLLLCLLACSWHGLARADACPPDGQDLASLRALKAQGFAVVDDGKRQQLAINLLACLDHADPELRDDIAYSAFSKWMRGKALPAETLRGLSTRLQASLAAGNPDGRGFGKPFAALVLSEVARTDRIEAWMTTQERELLIGNATAYLAGIRDYRGFIDGEGWRHGVAHSADVMLQLSLNPALDKAQLDRLLAAIAVQVPAHDGHAYIHGEPERLATPVYYIAKRNVHTSEQWTAWFAALTALPAGIKSEDVFRSQSALAWRHNVQAFLLQMHVSVNESGDAELKARLAPGLLEAIRKLP